ncbi:MAG TPA: carbamoyltransferase HypF [Candidatus Acidoferrum sp.]|jgi:hydrogenase maturation protein HypF|nr:carbamoyltransferase HypF [Candidatus Acidoferrum sp.]
MTRACSIRIHGVVQGVGFRPFVHRLARDHSLSGWVLNGNEGVEIHIEGQAPAVHAFIRDLKAQPPPASSIAGINVSPAEPKGLSEFTIRESSRREHPTVRVSPDLPVCDDCLIELFDPSDRRYLYPYINCTNCGPRYSVILALPYDRPNTTMKPWTLDDACASEYRDATDRRFHAQPVACPSCGPGYYVHPDPEAAGENNDSIRRAAEMLRSGKILAVKGIGGYHLACDAREPAAVASLRDRKYRREKPFAVMAKDLSVAKTLVHLSPEAEALLTSAARPIVLAPAKIQFSGVAPDNNELGVMLPYSPLHHLLFAAGAPDVLVMTSANRSSEPIAYEDDDALQRLAGVADSFLIGQRPIARRVDDSVARAGVFGPVVLRRARGYAPGTVTTLPSRRPILALGADLKNTITLVVDGQAFVSQHIGDLDHYQSLQAFQQTIDDLIAMYEVRWDELLLVHDLHPEYRSTAYAAASRNPATCAVQHHRAHIASVLAERREWTKRVIGVSFDGTGYGDDGSIWGGEIFVGSMLDGFSRVAHLRRAALAGGDAAARYPAQAAAGFLDQVEGLPDMLAGPFAFPERYRKAMELVRKDIRSFVTTSVGRLFDGAAALLGFTREATFEGQAAMWLEQLARSAPDSEPYSFPFTGDEFDFRPLLQAVVFDRIRGRNIQTIARSFQLGIAHGLRNAVMELSRRHTIDTIVLSGGVFQNELLLEDLKASLIGESLQIWTNHEVPPNDGGVSLGQAALAAFGRFDNLQRSAATVSELSHA